MDNANTEEVTLDIEEEAEATAATRGLAAE